MSDLEFERLIETSLRRPLSGAEKVQLQEHLEQNPASRAVWEEESELNRLLGKLPDAPLPSNFTARVLGALDREAPIVRTRWQLLQWLQPARPAGRIAWACAMVLLMVGIASRQSHLAARARMAASVTRVAEGVESTASLAQLPSVELWRDFESISRLPVGRGDRPGIGADEELLAALR